jgi:hypothetical protein
MRKVPWLGLRGEGNLDALRVDLDRFGFSDLLRPDRPDYVRGRNLRMAVTAAAPLDLAAKWP